MTFPKGFVWGAASAAYQVEGGYNSDGKGLSVWDVFAHTSGNVSGDNNGDTACDSYKLYKEDVKMLADMGLKAYRFSISWPRVMPKGDGPINEAGIKYYENLIDELIKNGIEPYVTLHHWDLPNALQEKGGWLNRDTAYAFDKFVKLIAKRFDKKVTNYITINEPQCIVFLGHKLGIHAPGLKLEEDDVCICIHNILLAHGLAVTSLRANSSLAIKVGVSSTGKLCYPSKANKESIEVANKLTFNASDEEWTFSHTWCLDPIVLGKYPDDVPKKLKNMPPSDMEIISVKTDFIGINIYNGKEVDCDGHEVKKYDGYPRTGLKWPVTEEVMHYGIKAIYHRYKLPVLITENGLACNDKIFLDGKIHDLDRIDFLSRYLIELNKCIEDDVPVIGYFHWSLTDNFEWHSGYDDRFGLVYMDYRTKKRIRKDSSYWFEKVVENNGLDF